MPRKQLDLVGIQEPRKQYAELSDEFNGSALGAQWSWVRPAGCRYVRGGSGGVLRFDTQAADLYVDSNNASVLLEPTPKQDLCGRDARAG